MQRISLFKKVLFGCVILLGIFFFMMRGTGSTAELFLWRASEPFVRFSSSAISVTKGIFAVFGSAADLTARIEILEHEKIALTSALGRLENIAQENEDLRAEYNLPPSKILDEYVTVDADVIGYSPGVTKAWIVINRGSDDGVDVGMAVVTRASVLVGIVAQSAQHTARINLVTHTESVIRGETSTLRTRGIIRGISHVGAQMTMVERSQPLTDGNTIMTVRNGRVPGRLFIGRLHNVHVAEDGLFQEAVVAPAYETVLRDRVRVVLIQENF